MNLTSLLLPSFNPPRGLKGEEALCVEIANYLRQMSLNCHDFPYVWFHVPNQFAGTYKGRFGALLTWMGRIAGTPDYIFLGNDVCFFVELKTSTGVQSDVQKMFEQWAKNKRVSYYIVRSLKDLEAILNSKGMQTNMPIKKGY